ncbi:MAG: hypothetical protein U0638_00610 [Phycisphaerales bacterium]
MGFFTQTPSANSRRLAEIERKLDLILAHLGIEIPPDEHEDVRALALSGEKIEAIKRYREKTGVSLAEAKQYVDSIV